jgi:hypothetical protein
VRTIEKRIIVLEIKDEYILGDGVSVGAQGSHDDVVLRMEFSSAWSETTKRVEWINAFGESVGVTIITPLMLHKENVYDVAVPAAVKEHGGKITLTVQGVIIDEVTGVETVKITTEEAHFRVLKSFSGITEQDDVMPSQAEQLQAEIDAIKQAVGGIIKVRDDAQNAATIAENNAERAESAAENAERYKNTAHDIRQVVEYHREKAQIAHSAAEDAAERAERAAERTKTMMDEAIKAAILDSWEVAV